MLWLRQTLSSRAIAVICCRDADVDVFGMGGSQVLYASAHCAPFTHISALLLTMNLLLSVLVKMLNRMSECAIIAIRDGYHNPWCVTERFMCVCVREIKREWTKDRNKNVPCSSLLPMSRLVNPPTNIVTLSFCLSVFHAQLYLSTLPNLVQVARIWDYFISSFVFPLHVIMEFRLMCVPHYFGFKTDILSWLAPSISTSAIFDDSSRMSQYTQN